MCLISNSILYPGLPKGINYSNMLIYYSVYSQLKNKSNIDILIVFK